MKERNGFIAQGVSSITSLKNNNTLSQIIPTFESICSVGLFSGDIPFYITAYISIDTLWFWIGDWSKSNQSRGNVDFNKAERNGYHDIYQNV